MYLKAIEIHGFKSFAEKVVLTFPKGSKESNSITAIVGPNGSGKSNVSDAIRWVMGEQKLTRLRAKTSHDVIFSGSTTKGQLGMASVTLFLDNSDHKIPLEYDEVTMTRRLYRTGESEYLVNGNAVRLIDLQILLAKAQFGHGSYSVIGQGTIDQMLLQSPADRKAFFDDAVGIKEFQIKRHQAALKLDRTKENIAQGEMVRAEIEPRLKTLSRQVKKLEQRQEVETELRATQEQYYGTLALFNRDHVSSLKETLASVATSFEKEESELRVLQEELGTLARAESRDDIFKKLQSEYQALLQKKNDKERERAVLQGRMQIEYGKAGKQNVAWLEQKVESLTKEIATLGEQSILADRESEQSAEQVQTLKKNIQDLSIERATLRSSLGRMEQERVEQKSIQSYSQMTGLRAVEAILSDRQRFGAVYGIVAQLGKVEERYQTAMDVAAGTHLSSIVVKDDVVAEGCIDYLRRERLGIATFLPLTKIQSRFIPTEVEELAKWRGVVGLAIDLVEFDEKFSDIFSYVFGNTLIVESIDVARSIGIGKIRMVTLDGDVLDKSGSMKGGFRRKDGGGVSFSQGGRMSGSFVDEEELATRAAEMQKKLERLELDYEKTVSDIQRLESTLLVAQGKRDLVRDQQAQLERERASLSQELSLSTLSPEQYDSVMQDIASSRETVEREIAEIEKDVEQSRRALDRFNEEEEEKKQRVFQLQDAMQQSQVRVNEIVSQKNNLQIELAKYETRGEDLAREIEEEMHLSLSALLSRQIEVVAFESLDHVHGEIQKLKYTLSLIGGIDEEVVREHAETQERYDALMLQLDDLNKALSDMEKMIDELDHIMKQKRAKAFKEIKKEFSRYFTILFEGGKADLIEVYGEEGEEAQDDENAQGVQNDGDTEEGEEKKARKKKVLIGIDVVANPPGKKIAHLQSLSGGERTMTSIALVCAILRVNPSPFVVLDEVEAALDEANSVRLNNIIRELAEESQFILITHNRATMHAADALYGVTMGVDGMSHLLSVKLGEAIEQVS